MGSPRRASYAVFSIPVHLRQCSSNALLSSCLKMLLITMVWSNSTETLEVHLSSAYHKATAACALLQHQYQPAVLSVHSLCGLRSGPPVTLRRAAKKREEKMLALRSILQLPSPAWAEPGHPAGPVLSILQAQHLAQ